LPRIMNCRNPLSIVQSSLKLAAIILGSKVQKQRIGTKTERELTPPVQCQSL
jgi:hypothetical protein